MLVLRFLLEVILYVVLFPLIVVFEIVWLFVCIRAAHYYGTSAKEGFKVWVQYIITGLKMNKDFVINGL